MDSNIIKNLFRIGMISSVNVSNMTARVRFVDRDNTESYDLHILNRGSKTHKDYWIPSIDEQVLCCYLPAIGGSGVGEGFIIGSFFSDVDTPIKTGVGVRRIDFGDGSFVEHDTASGSITINATGDVIIQGANVRINE